ncbi:GumC family protein [Phenylobacterium aquaticum]|uniref:GumC family protein n=1 Tax=Phenylobacterium aquaticum TaxID=1763816 RepID=UPI001F5CED54|nr:polysaccharide biosynthesis tyrosine autokinase [Phenylobacterium aquaticum]MCI3132728.1 polysaccharide biosynthesis tyrosine autokinase [Phenylobacterium aquaticum]
MSQFSPAPLGADLPPQVAGSQDVAAGGLGQQIDLRRIYSAFRRRLRLFGAVALAVFVAVVVVTLQATPKYTATANVLLDTRKEKVSDVQEVLSGLPADSATVDTEVEILKSRQLAERVTKALDLEADPEFNSRVHKPEGLAAVTASIGAILGATPPSEVKLSPLGQQKLHEKVVDTVLSGLSVKRSGLTYVINVAYQSQSPQKAATIANKFAELYLLEQLEAKFDATQQANKWLSSRLEELRGQVLQDEATVQQYKIANNLLSASGTSLTEQEISSYNQSLAQARAQVAEDNARLNTAKQQLARGSNGGDVGEALDSPVIQQLRAQRAQVSGQVADLAGRYGDRHPEMLKAKRQLSDIDAQIQQEIQRIVSNLQAKAQVSSQRASAVAGSLGGAKGALATNNRASVKLNELERNAEASRTLYESYLNRFKETSSQQGIEQSDARVVSKAKIPTKQSSPNVSLNLALGVLLAIGAGLGAIVLAEMLDAGVATAEDVERRLETAYLGSIPLLNSVADANGEAPIDYIVSKPLSSFSESFRNLRASIVYSRLGEPVKIVAVTSSLPGEGKTTTSVCLARSSALQGLRTVIVDCDLRRRTVNRLLKTEPVIGLLEVLSGEHTLDEALTFDEASGASFLPLAKSNFTPKDVFGTVAMDRLLEQLRSRYDLVILDTAPLLPIADTRVLAPKADAVVFLARWRKTPQHAIEAAFRLLQGSGAHLAGVALTQVDMKQQAKYGYGDPGYYYAEYKKYYVS